jgi:hypothetical protein
VCRHLEHVEVVDAAEDDVATKIELVLLDVDLSQSRKNLI